MQTVKNLHNITISAVTFAEISAGRRCHLTIMDSVIEGDLLMLSNDGDARKFLCTVGVVDSDIPCGSLSIVSIL